ncbi:hypothetical protein [Staphylococcus massiliensis]|uniref:hypothetical protein n=1 Tax=Staphylococcus massiliensis TaxID=555791 RepID=UPI0002F66D61|nr:hypothetical protein [Staphylococcus massiliensis]MCG3398823.1 hypothetical protein [Staphylococcus massiliensis]MCG3401384.1 hypothetical protein [Staphylococcus massiliensis]MCG3411834.1 hypothetical protein [Staphylococcus massiliensis]
MITKKQEKYSKQLNAFLKGENDILDESRHVDRVKHEDAHNDIYKFAKRSVKSKNDL